MSDDLISRKALLDSMDKRYKEKFGIVQDNLAEGFMQMEKLIKEQPTAYDVDKVIEKLKTELSLADKEKGRCARENPLQFDIAKGYAQGISVALEIVKSGGVADD